MAHSKLSQTQHGEKYRITLIVGARPQFVKLGPLVRSLAQAGNVQHTVIHTGQHYDANMSDVFFQELEIPEPDFNLGVNGSRHGATTGRMIEEIESILLDVRPHAVVVVGDTNSTLAGAIAASKVDTLLVHVEAGLRSRNRKMPEEQNRITTDHLSDLLFAPTTLAVENLNAEGIFENIELVGDPMYDAALFALAKASKTGNCLDDLGLRGTRYSVVTLHRAENTASRERLGEILDYVRNVSAEMPIIFPLHPRTAQAIAAFGLSLTGLRCIAPLGYLDLQALLAGCELVMTDSGGVQREAYFHRRMCVTLRDETEWGETVDAGWNRLWTDADWKTPRIEITDYGDGHAADLISSKIIDFISAKMSRDSRAS